jgi:hypothetical protein
MGQIFLTSALVGEEWSASSSCRFTPGESGPDTLYIRDWAGPTAGLDDMEKLYTIWVHYLPVH